MRQYSFLRLAMISHNWNPCDVSEYNKSIDWRTHEHTPTIVLAAKTSNLLLSSLVHRLGSMMNIDLDSSFALRRGVGDPTMNRSGL